MGRSLRTVDKEAVERDYRLGLKTMMQIADEYGVDKATICRWAKKGGWSRDLSEQVRVSTRAKVTARVVQEATKMQQERDFKDATAVDIESDRNALLLAEQERCGTKGRVLMEAIIDKAAEQVSSMPTIAELIEMLKDHDENATAAAYKAFSLANVVDIGKKAIEGSHRASDLECRSRGMNAKDDGGDIGQAVSQAILSMS